MDGKCVAKISNLLLSDVSFHALNAPKPISRPPLRPGPRWGSLRHSPRPPSRLGRGTPRPIPFPLDAYTPRFLDLLQDKFLATPMDAVPGGNNDSRSNNGTLQSTMINDQMIHGHSQNRHYLK